MPGQAHIHWSQSTSGTTTTKPPVLSRIISTFLAKGWGTGKPVDVRGRFIDLDDDGVPEIVSRQRGPYLCRPQANCYTVLKAEKDGGYKPFFGVAGTVGVTVLGSKTNGWRDIEVNDRTYHYEGGRYVTG